MVYLRLMWPAIAALVVLSGCSKESDQAQAPAPTQEASKRKAFDVRTAPVETRRVIYEIEAVGDLVEENRFEIPARVAGVADQVQFAEGDKVTTGQQLARIDYDRYALQVRQAESELAEKVSAVERATAAVADVERATSTALETARVTVDLAQGEFKRRADRGANAFTSPEERDQFEAKFRQAQTGFRDAVNAASTQVALAQAELREQEAALETARAELALAEDNLERSIVKAPIAGVIQQRNVVEGEFVSQGDMVALMLQADPLRLRFTVPESRASRLTENMAVKFTVPAYRDRSFTGQVYDIGSFADAERNIVCWARVTNLDDALKPGFFAHVDLEVESREEAVVVPLAAILPTELGMTAYVIQDNVAVRRGVETGLHVTGDAVEILAGLEPGEQLVVEGMNALQDGVPVNILPPTTPDMPIESQTTVSMQSAANPAAQRSGTGG